MDLNTIGLMSLQEKEDSHYKKKNIETPGEYHVKMEAEIEVIQLQANEGQGLMTITRS